ncbi:DUF3237 family protein [uncultured Shimia sp.]|uniref:DUF3237 family protein n=1 Tax=uncultured Shimia sp. TaxID=573152 RepID=UPI00262E219D|nr:DUF3237 family protein [uncultured Shimia sp.]
MDVVNVGTRHGPAEVVKRLAAGEDVDPTSCYMPKAARLESCDDLYVRVNHTLFTCAGIRRASAAEIACYKVDCR